MRDIAKSSNSFELVAIRALYMKLHFEAYYDNAEVDYQI